MDKYDEVTEASFKDLRKKFGENLNNIEKNKSMIAENTKAVREAKEAMFSKFSKIDTLTDVINTAI